MKDGVFYKEPGSVHSRSARTSRDVGPLREAPRRLDRAAVAACVLARGSGGV